MRGKLRAVGFLVPEMQHAGREAPILALDAAADHADDDVGILQTPADEGGFKSVDSIEIGAEEGEIPTAHAVPLIRETLAQRSKRQAQQRQQAIDVAACAFHGPSAKTPAFGFEISCENAFRQPLRQQHAIAANKKTRLGKPAMRRDEIGPRQAVAVEENQIAARTRHDRAIADFGEAEPAVLLPDMLERHADLRGPTLDDLT